MVQIKLEPLKISFSTEKLLPVNNTLYFHVICIPKLLLIFMHYWLVYILHYDIQCTRFGKILWFNLPEDVLASDDPLDVKTFAEFVFSNTNLSQLFCTE